MFFAAPAKFLVVLRPGNGTPSTFFCRLRVSAIPPARPARPAPATKPGVLSFLTVDPTVSPAPVAALTDASFAFSTVPLLLEALDEPDRFRAVRAVDPPLLCALRLFCARLELDRDFVVRDFVDELRGFDPPPLDFLVLLLLVCCATRPSLRAAHIGYPGPEPIVGICGLWSEMCEGRFARGVGPAPAPGRHGVDPARKLRPTSTYSKKNSCQTRM
jgi:hypothetical protein